METLIYSYKQGCQTVGDYYNSIVYSCHLLRN